MTHAMLLRVQSVQRALPAHQRLSVSLIGAILTGWDAGQDTYDISKALDWHEAVVGRVIGLDVKSRRRARQRIVATA